MEWWIWITWSYFISDIQDIWVWIYFKKHNANVYNPSIRIHVNKIENRILFKNKKIYYLDLSTYETMKLLESIENKIIEDKNS